MHALQIKLLSDKSLHPTQNMHALQNQLLSDYCLHLGLMLLASLLHLAVVTCLDNVMLSAQPS